MGRVYYYVMFAVILAILMEISGVVTSSQSGLLNTVGILNVERGEINTNSVFFIAIMAVIGLISVAGLAIGLFTKIDISFLMAEFIALILTVTFVGALWDIIIITSGYANYIRVPMLVLMAPFTIGYILSLFEYLRSNV